MSTESTLFFTINRLHFRDRNWMWDCLIIIILLYIIIIVIVVSVGWTRVLGGPCFEVCRSVQHTLWRRSGASGGSPTAGVGGYVAPDQGARWHNSWYSTLRSVLPRHLGPCWRCRRTTYPSGEWYSVPRQYSKLEFNLSGVWLNNCSPCRRQPGENSPSVCLLKRRCSW